VFSRRIVGWNVAATLKADILPLQALDMTAFDAGGDLTGLPHHSDHGSNYTALVYTDRIAELGAIPSTGTVGDSYDCQSVCAGFRKNRVVLAGTV
jgi:putative transposase